MLFEQEGRWIVSTINAKSFVLRYAGIAVSGAIAVSSCGGLEKTTGTTGGECGGIAGFTCPPGMFCDFPSGMCGHGDAMGTCREMPEACTQECTQVCGCDGRSYCNACAAHAAGIDEAEGVICDDTPQG